MEKMLKEINAIVDNWVDDFLFIFNEYREVCSHTDLASYIVKAVSDCVFEIADEFDGEEEEEGEEEEW